jgi:cellulose biosynthesis protein BcsQ
MAKDKEREKSKVVLINSFKGGAGKTSISLASCVTAALENQNNNDYNKIFYFDIDFLGTGSYYKLFPNGVENRNFFNNYYKDDWNKFPMELFLKKNGIMLGSFYALYIDPKLRIKKKYENTIIRMNDKEEQILTGNIVDFIEKEIEYDKSSLFILDCSPGFNKLERNLIIELNKNLFLDVREVFVTSYDSSHVEKTVECLKEYCNTNTKRKKIHIILNDIHNISQKKEYINLSFNLAKNEINRLFQMSDENNSYKEIYCLYENFYSESLCASNLLLNKVGIENSFDDYNIIGSFYKEVIKYGNNKKND